MELFYSKNYFNLKNISFEVIPNGSKSECSRFEQRSVIKFLVAEKCKTFEIYRRMCYVYGETCSSQKNLYKWAKYRFATTNLNQKDSSWNRNTLTLWQRKNTRESCQWNKADHAVFWDMKGPITIDFLAKSPTVNSISYCQLLKKNSPYLLNDPHC